MKELSFLTVSRSSAFWALAGASLALLAACGDDVTEVNQNGIEMISTVSAEKCTEADNGRTVFASVENSLFVCSKGEWQDLSGADGVNGTDGISGTSCKVAKATADSMWFKCGDQTTVVELPAGVAGKVGAAGADGESCKVSKMSADSVWFKCGDQVTSMELPEGAKGATGATGAEGAKGEKGDKGDDGASCEITRVANDSLWFKCGDKLTGVELPEGAKGATGAAGAAGAKGDKGETGAAGTSCEISKTTSDSLWFKCGDQEKSIPLPKGSVDPAEAEQLQKVYQKKVYLQKEFNGEDFEFLDIKWPYATVWIEELDPKTMMPTGKSFSFQAGLDADKDASFEDSYSLFKTYSVDVSVSNILSSLVRVRVELGYMNYHDASAFVEIPAHSLYAVTNLEDETPVYVSLASDLKSARVQKLVADGKTYEEANEQANTEIYDAFGLDDETVAKMTAAKLIDCYDEPECAIKNNVESFDVGKLYNAKTYADYQEGCRSLFAWIDLGVLADGSNVDKVSGWNAARKIFAETGSLTGNLNLVENSQKLEPQIFVDLYFDGLSFPASLVVEKYLTFKDDSGKEVVCSSETIGALAQLTTENSLYYGVWFGCNGYEWQKTPVEIKNVCSAGSDNKLKTIKYGDKYYTCKQHQESWLWAEASDAEIYVSKLPTCSSETDGAYDYSDDFGYSICKKIDGSWVWVSTAADFVNIYNAKCDASKDGQLVTEGLPLSELPVVCDKNNEFFYFARLASASEFALKKACLKDGETMKVNDRDFTCSIDSDRDIHTWRGTVDFNRDIQIDGNHSAVKEPPYNTVVIDTLEWMTDDLNYEPENEGKDESNGIRCVNPSSSASVCSYRLYTWEASQQEGVCPEDWRIPTEDEFQKLYDAAANLGGCVWSPGNALTPCVGNALKSSSGWNSSELHGWQYRGSDYLGFNASGSGYYYADMQIGGYAAASWGGRTNYWTATKGKTFYIEGRDGAKFRDAEDGDPFYSVRCVRTFKVN